MRRDFLRAHPSHPDGRRRLPADVRFLVARGLPGRHAWQAVETAARRGHFAATVLMGEGGISPAIYYRCLASELGVPFVDIDKLKADPRLAARLPDIPAGQLHALALEGAPGESRLAIAPSPAGIGLLMRHLARHPWLRGRIAITTPQNVERIRRCEVAIQRLQRKQRLSSASFILTARQKNAFIYLALLASAAIWLTPVAAFIAALVVAWPVFIGSGLIRATAAFSVPMPEAVPSLAQDDLPSFSLLIPLYREAAIVDELIVALQRLDYPCDRLQIMFVVEADDGETLQALRNKRLSGPFGLCLVPPCKPRTKPKALSYALQFANGEIITVYDAEDRPDPDQLCKVANIFANGPPDLGCVQAQLAIDHGSENLLTRYFALEYALQFEVLMPWLAAFRLPIRLGGTSNHIHRRALRESGGWDPYNVTEDLDLGIRMLRHGWKVAGVRSTTWEEAPLTLRAWFYQRTRWHKGWLQTWLVHMRQPRRLLVEIGVVDACVIAGIFAGTFLSLVAHPVSMALLTIYALNSNWWPQSQSIVSGLALTTIVVGYGGHYLAMRRAAKIRRLRLGWRETLGLPFYWLLMSSALVAAVIELVRDPFRWRKTTHGLAHKRPPPPAHIEVEDLQGKLG